MPGQALHLKGETLTTHISIDPGLSCSGVCVWENGAVTKLDTLKPCGPNPHEKMKNLFLLFRDLIRKIAESTPITKCAIEDIPPFVNPKRQLALFKLAKAAAYIEMAFVEADIPLMFISKDRRSKDEARKIAAETTSITGSQHAYDALFIGHLAGFSNDSR